MLAIQEEALGLDPEDLSPVIHVPLNNLLLLSAADSSSVKGDFLRTGFQGSPSDNILQQDIDCVVPLTEVSLASSAQNQNNSNTYLA